MPKDLAMTSVIPLVFAFVRTTLLETAVTIVLLDFSISQPVKVLFLAKHTNKKHLVIVQLFIDCMCNAHGSVGKACDADGKCTCQHGFTGDKCDQCLPEHYMFNNDCAGKSVLILHLQNVPLQIKLQN